MCKCVFGTLTQAHGSVNLQESWFHLLQMLVMEGDYVRFLGPCRSQYPNKITGMHFMASQAIYEYVQFHEYQLNLQQCMHHSIIFYTEIMGDLIQLHQASRQLNSPQFIIPGVLEINGHLQNEHWGLINCEDVPKQHKVTLSVWAWGTHTILLITIKFYKTWFNLHSTKQVNGVNYFEIMLMIAFLTHRYQDKSISWWLTLKPP